MPRYTLRTLLILLAVLPPVLAGACWIYVRDREARYVYDLYHDSRRYPELEEWLIKQGKARRGEDAQLYGIPGK